jgi:hypothetical protein
MSQNEPDTAEMEVDSSSSIDPKEKMHIPDDVESEIDITISKGSTDPLHLESMASELLRNLNKPTPEVSPYQSAESSPDLSPNPIMVKKDTSEIKETSSLDTPHRTKTAHKILSGNYELPLPMERGDHPLKEVRYLNDLSCSSQCGATYQKFMISNPIIDTATDKYILIIYWDRSKLYIVDIHPVQVVALNGDPLDLMPVGVMKPLQPGIEPTFEQKEIMAYNKSIQHLRHEIQTRDDDEYRYL